jgi:hypothetical protein
MSSSFEMSTNGRRREMSLKGLSGERGSREELSRTQGKVEDVAKQEPTKVSTSANSTKEIHRKRTDRFLFSGSDDKYPPDEACECRRTCSLGDVLKITLPLRKRGREGTRTRQLPLRFEDVADQEDEWKGTTHSRKPNTSTPESESTFLCTRTREGRASASASMEKSVKAIRESADLASSLLRNVTSAWPTWAGRGG